MAMRERHPELDVRWMCAELGVSRSGFYSFVKASKRPVSEKEMKDRDLVRQAYDFKGRDKGARTIKMILKNELGAVMNLKKVRRIMRETGIVCGIRRANPMRRMARAMKTNSIFGNKLNRQFRTSKPGEHLLTDITYIYYGSNGRCYLSSVKDASTNEIIAWRLSESLDVSFVIETVKQIQGIPWMKGRRPLIHSDQGCHYTSQEYISYLSEMDYVQSMSRRGNCWDNAPQESFHGHMKDELHLSECRTFERALQEISDYMDYYNHHRCQWGLKRMTPVQYREHLLSQPSWEICIVSGSSMSCRGA